ncbi:MAG: HAD-IC family P-type ATPase, partial [bacterium]|nr:HAD-IC family P-type ATPase [bacterium]
IGIAERELDASHAIEPDNVERLRGLVSGLRFLGLVALRDPIREDVVESIRVAKKAGVRVIMVTGDHRLTALAIGADLGLGSGPASAMEGSELDALSDEELARRITTVDIFARVNPKHKMRIVKALKDNGEVVAMTGDGVNDAPALKAADVGISVGSGTDVTKEAADLILLNDSFTVITQAIRQGRIAFDNMRKVVIFLFMGSFTELIIIMAALIMKTSVLPITAILILWANVVEDGLPTLALAFEPGDEGIMERGPYKREEPIMDRMGWTFVFIQGIITDFILVGVYLYYLNYLHYSAEHIQTLIFFALGTDALLIIFSLKNLDKSIFKTNILNNKYLIFSVLLGFVIVGVVVYMPVMNKALGTVPLKAGDVAFLMALGLFKVVYSEIIKWWFRRRGYFTLQPSVVK